MNSFDARNSLRALRPEIPSIDLASTSNPVEHFQNETLRPLLKFQNEILIVAFEQYAKDKKGVFFKLEGIERADYISRCVRKDPKTSH